MKNRLGYEHYAILAVGVYRTDVETASEAAGTGSMHILPNDLGCASVNSASQLRDHLDTIRAVQTCWGAPEEMRVALHVVTVETPNDHGGYRRWIDDINPDLIFDAPQPKAKHYRVTLSYDRLHHTSAKEAARAAQQHIYAQSNSQVFMCEDVTSGQKTVVTLPVLAAPAAPPAAPPKPAKMEGYTVQVGRDARAFYTAAIRSGLARNTTALEDSLSRHGFAPTIAPTIAPAELDWQDSGVEPFDQIEVLEVMDPGGEVISRWTGQGGWSHKTTR